VMHRRAQYRFIGRDGDQYVWESTRPLPGDSRSEQIRCSVEWFWHRDQKTEATP
jgi:hypothetical protein